MSMRDTPRSERLPISFFGCRNAGKSSILNAVTAQQAAIVSEVAGTTTDPVSKSMELLPIGPVLLTDTPGIDDEGGLGQLRVKKTIEVLGRTDVGVVAVDVTKGLTRSDEDLLKLFQERGLPCILVWNKTDLADDPSDPLPGKAVPAFPPKERQIFVSAKDGRNIHELKELIGRVGNDAHEEKPLASDLVRPLDLVVLVIPIDSAAPKGRLILPQQQVLRDLLDHGVQALCVRQTELKDALDRLGTPPALVITDSQAFGSVSKDVPEDVPMTSFSILMARHKGALKTQLRGVGAIRDLKDGDRVLIAEGCTHHRQCGDIGTVKLPAWIRKYSGAEPVFETSSGLSFPEDLSVYKAIVHCGGCMLNEREVAMRNERAASQGVPITNYGMVIALVHGILERALKIVPEASDFFA